ncbi:MAG: trypsin-like peptidase domain-containing protein [Gammaproteobacteria bacterium]
MNVAASFHRIVLWTVALIHTAVLAVSLIPNDRASADNHPCAVADSYECTRSLAEAGIAEAQFNLGVLYDNGEGVAEDDREAARWFRLAAEQGNAKAQFNLGNSYYNGEGVVTSKREAVRWYRLAAEQGNAKAQNNLGFAYNNGEGIPTDKREAVRWYRLAAEQGNVAAQNNLGFAYDNGEVVATDKREAVHWYRRAAEQGLAIAQVNLGIKYSVGEGVVVDNREAVRWFRLAAEQGNAEAQYILGTSYWNGNGVIEDEREAYIWYSIAKVNGDKDAADSLRKLPWHQYLTAAEIKSAKREAARRLAEIDARKTEREQGGESESGLSGVLSAEKLPQTSGVAEHVFEQAWRSIVVIKTDEGQGSGVIIRPNIVATNCHVIDGGGEIVVYKHDNRRASTDTLFAASVRRRNAEKDFCLLDAAGLWGVPAAVRKYDTLKIGENVYALGSPKGLDLSLFTGVISQLRRGESARYIQTDAAISPGSSGGGLFDSEGNLIGILTSKISDEDVEGIGFAIPADLALDL